MDKPDTLARIETALVRIALLIEGGEEWAWSLWDRLEDERDALMKRHERLAHYLPPEKAEKRLPCTSRAGLPLRAGAESQARRARVKGKRPALMRPLTRAQRKTRALPGSAEALERPGSHRT